MEHYFEKKIWNNELKRKYSFLISFCLIIVVIICLKMTVLSAGLEEVKRDLQIINPKPELFLSINLDKGIGATYSPGERIRISFRVNIGSYITLFGYDNQGNVQLLFPNQNQKNSWVQPGIENYVDYGVDLERHTGIEYIQGFATREPVLITEEIEKSLERVFIPRIDTNVNTFSSRIKNTLSNLPFSFWASSEILHYQIVDRKSETGKLYITSQPGNANVYLNGIYSGQTPINLEQLSSGEYSVVIELGGYKSWMRNIDISNNKTTFLSADLMQIEQYGSIIIRCNESIARIYLDNQFKRLTHANRDVVLEEVNAGLHDLRIVLDGYYDWFERVEVKPLQRIFLDVELDKIKQAGSLEVTCNVENALIYLDGEYREKTSARGNAIIDNLLEGNYHVLITKEGFYDYSTNIMVYDEFTSHLDVQLQEKYQEKERGSIVIYSNEDDGRVYLNGEYRISTSAAREEVIGELEEGIFEITVIKEGYNTWLGDVTVFAGEITSLFIDLTRTR